MSEKNWEWHALRAEDKVKTLEHQLAAARAELSVERRALEVSVRLTLAAIGLPAPHASERTVKSMMDDCRRKASAELAKAAAKGRKEQEAAG